MGSLRPPLPEGPWLVVGLARSGAAAAQALLERGARVYGTDSGNPPDAGRLAGLGVELSLDGDGTELLDRVNAVVKSPGVPSDAPAIVAARKAGREVMGELELGWRLLPNRFVAVTGTNGKTTVVEWLGHVWREAGEPVAVAGNVGTPLASLVGRIGADDVVCECSSFQLEDSSRFAPDVAALLNLSPDHLDRHGTIEAYRDAKLKIFANQGAGDVAVFDEAAVGPASIPGSARRAPFGIAGCADGGCEIRCEGGAIHDREGVLAEATSLALAGEHNLRNAMAVAAASLAAGIDRAAVARGLQTFAGVPHRLEAVAEIGGVSYVNDSKATNVAAAAAALGSYRGGVHAILGGSLKGGGFADLAPAVAESCRACYLIGDAEESLARDLDGTGVALRRCGSLERAVSEAAAAAVAGETVLLAPACASFDAFRNYEERGERFRELVGALR